MLAHIVSATEYINNHAPSYTERAQEVCELGGSAELS